MVATIIFVALAYLIYKLFVDKFHYWRKRGVPGPPPLPVIGNFPSKITGSRHIAYEYDEIYRTYRSNRFVGIFEFFSPSIFVIDPELVRNLLITDFKSFHDNGFGQIFNKETDQLFGRNPFVLRGDEWKEKRNEILQGFSSNRLKAFLPLFEHTGSLLSNYLRKETKKDAPIEVREVCSKYSCEAASSIIYGVDSEVFSQENSEIKEMGRKAIDNNFRGFLKNILISLFPWISKFLEMRFFSVEVERFFIQLMKNAYEQRRDAKIKRQDYLDYLIQLKDKIGISELEMAAHGLTFFIDGFESASLAITHALYELSRNKLIQNKLRREITETIEKNGKVTYEYLAGDSYLDQVFHEALRLHPPVVVLSRQITEETEWILEENEKIKLEKNINVFVPVWSIHRDPSYYDEPELFNPERFDVKNGGVKKFKDRGVFLGFGDGPRVCVGQKFALIQSKACIIEILLNFELTLNSRTQEPLRVDPKRFLNSPYGGVWIDFKEIK